MKRKSELARIWAQTKARAESNDTTSSNKDNDKENGKFYCFKNKKFY